MRSGKLLDAACETPARATPETLPLQSRHSVCFVRRLRGEEETQCHALTMDDAGTTDDQKNTRSASDVAVRACSLETKGGGARVTI